MPGKPKAFLFAWRDAFMSARGPASTMRHVLLALSTHMSTRQGTAFPSIGRLAEETGLSERCVGEHLRNAVRIGWIQVKRVRQPGRQWAQNVYQATYPNEWLSAEAPASTVEPRSRPSRQDVPINSSDNSSKNSPTDIEERRTRASKGSLAFRSYVKEQGLLKGNA